MKIFLEELRNISDEIYDLRADVNQLRENWHSSKDHLDSIAIDPATPTSEVLQNALFTINVGENLYPKIARLHKLRLVRLFHIAEGIHALEAGKNLR